MEYNCAERHQLIERLRYFIKGAGNRWIVGAY